jgi:putative transcriptional regulator
MPTTKKAVIQGTPPTANEVKARRLAVGLTQTEAAELVHTKCRTWQQWEASEDSVTHRQMHPAFWELFVIKTSKKR